MFPSYPTSMQKIADSFIFVQENLTQ